MEQNQSLTPEQYQELKNALVAAVHDNSIGGVEMSIIRYINAFYKPDKSLEEKLIEMGFDELQTFALMQRFNMDINDYELHTVEVVNPSDYEGKPLPEIKWIINNMLSEGVSILAAPPKYHKSFLAMQLAVAVCNGTDFFGYPTNRGDVIYLDLESNKHRPLNRLKHMYDTTDINGLHIVTASSNIRRLDHGFDEDLTNLLIRYPNTKLVIVDILQNIVPQVTREYSYSSDYNTISLLNDLACRFRISIFAVHHTRKMRDDDDHINNISGSTGLTGAVSTIFIIAQDKRGADCASLLINGNDIEDISLSMHFDKEKLMWICDGDTATVMLDLFKEKVEAQTILNLMKSKSSWTGNATDLSVAAADLGYSISPEDFGRFIKFSTNEFNQLGYNISKVRRGDARTISISRQ